jgi:hypothetical protein
MVVRKPRWVWVYVISAAGVVAIFVCETMSFSPEMMHVAEFIILGILYGLLELWLRANSFALLNAPPHHLWQSEMDYAKVRPSKLSCTHPHRERS